MMCAWRCHLTHTEEGQLAPRFSPLRASRLSETSAADCVDGSFSTVRQTRQEESERQRRRQRRRQTGQPHDDERDEQCRQTTRKHISIASCLSMLAGVGRIVRSARAAQAALGAATRDAATHTTRCVQTITRNDAMNAQLACTSTVVANRRCFSSAGAAVRSSPSRVADTSSVVAASVAPSATLLDGIMTSADILAGIAAEVRASTAAGHRAPGLAVLLATRSRDSQRYVERKGEVARQVGFISHTHTFEEETVTAEQMLQCIHDLNADSAIDGILVQLPLPAHLAPMESTILSSVAPQKDVDGFHPTNVANLTALASTSPAPGDDGNVPHHAKDIYHVPCTPKACLELIDRSVETSSDTSRSPSRHRQHMLTYACMCFFSFALSYGIALAGKHVAVLGRSAAVGLPLTLLLMQRQATVTNIDRTLPESHARALCSDADVVITAVGQAGYIRSGWVKSGATVIDVGINFVPKLAPLTGHAALLENPLDARDQIRLVGDAHFDECASKAAFLTPVPGGVGPMTVAMLMDNTLKSFQHTIATSKAHEQK